MSLILNELDVVLEGLREFLVGLATSDGSLPTGQSSIDWLDLHVGSGGHPVGEHAIHFVSRTDFDFVEFVEHVSFGERDIGHAVNHQGILEGNQVKPTATSWSSGCCTILVAFLAEKFARLVRYPRGCSRLSQYRRRGRRNAAQDPDP